MILLSLCVVSPVATACDQLAAGTSFWVRLTQPISSYDAKSGTPVHAMLLESPECDGVALLPIKIPVEGHVVSARRVGLGLVHETAQLEIEFSQILPSQGSAIGISGRV